MAFASVMFTCFNNVAGTVLPNIQFGCVGIAPAPSAMSTAPCAPTTPRYAHSVGMQSGTIVSPTIEYDEKIKRFDEMVLKQTEVRLSARSGNGIKIRKDGTMLYGSEKGNGRTIKTKTTKKVWKEKPYIFPAHQFIVSSIQFAGVNKEALVESPIHKGIVRALSKKSPKKNFSKCLTLKKETLESFENSLFKHIKKTGMSFEIIGKRAKKSNIKARFVSWRDLKLLKVETIHERGFKRRVDLRITPMHGEFLKMAQKSYVKMSTVSADTFQPGDSGLVFLDTQITGNRGRAIDDLFIVRGRCEGKLFNSLSKVTYNMCFRMQYYSGVGEKFFESFSQCFVHNRPKNLDHACHSDLTVEECGTLAALITQTIFQFGKITCSKCAFDFANLSEEEMRDRVNREIDGTLTNLKQKFPSAIHVIRFIEDYKRMINFHNPNVETFTKTHQLLASHKTQPFNDIKRLNEIIIRGSMMTVKEMSEATDIIYELAKFQKNRTDNIKDGSIEHFRNKVSGKTTMNFSLMCDNQLDKNGNFIWGQRGYHAKRFFSNYFDVIKPENGYEKYQIRRVPDGSRTLAIKNLIVTTDLEILREQMRGEVIEQPQLSKACVSRLNGSFAYPCCCVTTEEGKPMKSIMLRPTKNHLVIGNTGDSKFVDLPQEINENMYIAKEGYCYLNIFLAMLVNVNEDGAKNFTKMVRDKIVENKLGKWPTMMDVATACYLLTVFFPETSNAELPKILVDHNTKTMHVVDSYGSKTTGYHILKANTVSQLIQFADLSLESELKFYTVGGSKPEIDNCHSGAIKLLIKAVYRPKLMEIVLKEEPYLILMSLLSPGVLLALFNSGNLEKAVHMWIKREHGLAYVATTLAALAQKVSLAKTVNEQICIINKHAPGLMDMVFQGTQPTHSYIHGITLLTVIMARENTNADLDAYGFKVFPSRMTEMLEKNYLMDLEDSWRDLSLWEKYYAMRESRRWFRVTPKPLVPTDSADLGGRYDISWRSLLGRVKNGVKLQGSKIRRGVSGKINFMKQKVYSKSLSLLLHYMPTVFNLINMLIIVNLLVMIISTTRGMIIEHQRNKMAIAQIEDEKKVLIVQKLHEKYIRINGGEPTIEEFLAFVAELNPDVYSVAQDLVGESECIVEHQAKRISEARLEQAMAFVALFLMAIDSEKSDCVYKVLNKLRNLMMIADTDVYHQSLDEIRSELDEKKLTIDFTLDDSFTPSIRQQEPTFEDWWTNQIDNTNVVSHYRTEGFFMEFTRQNAANVAHRISHEGHKDILLRGAVGSGKSTGLPYELSQRGSVLLIEPTRPLAENVHKQLQGHPFLQNPTLRMRGLSSFGSTRITIMTSGFALHYFANNVEQLRDFDYVIFDECHVLDSSAMAFRCLLHDIKSQSTVIKVSATPPGRECEFKTQHPVDIRIEDELSFQNFVQGQGTGCNYDVIKDGDNILVYVASYNEVDSLSKLLNDRSFKVTKVDGRTMKLGNTEIATSGSSTKKHFIVATNIIENGVTLDIDVVVDFGTKVIPQLDVDNRMVSYSKGSISFGERIQRLGRVGRVKKGVALRIGKTMQGLAEVPTMIATEAAFLCFTYGLPVMTHNVSVSLLRNCTVKQARTMLHFEISPMYTINLVRYDGCMHPEVHKVLKKFKLRDSEITLSSLALPSRVSDLWISAKSYNKMGARLLLDDDIKIPFLVRDVPEQVHVELWNVITDHKKDNCFGRINSASACKIAYTLQTDVHAIPRTIQIIDKLIEQEQMKKSHFRSLVANNSMSGGATLLNIVNTIRSKYTHDHTQENIDKLHRAKGQLLEYANLQIDASFPELIKNFSVLECVHHQSLEGVSKQLSLKGKWNKSLITKDIIVIGGVLIGGSYMIYSWFRESFNAPVFHQGNSKRAQQKLKFRNSQGARRAREVYGDDEVLGDYFGEAYTKKGKKSGKTHGMGSKNRKFVNMYSYDADDFSFVRYVDPLTGHTIDEHPLTDMRLVADKIIKMRLEEGVDRQFMGMNPKVEAYFSKGGAKEVIKVDMMPHNPLEVCVKGTIAGYPERAGEMRQTGKPIIMPVDAMPQSNPSPEYEEGAIHEADCLYKGVRDYNPIAASICKLTNDSDGHVQTLYGVGYGSVIITNQHLFERNNGILRIQSHHGDFTVPNTTTIQMFPCAKRDVLLFRLPKDFPPFPQKLKFRNPISNERVCMVGTNFQEKSTSSTISEVSTIHPKDGCAFWKHWISTKDGYCGLPLVSTTDGCILGLHSLANVSRTQNYFIDFPDNFEEQYLKKINTLEWVKHWKYNANNINYGSLTLHQSQPDGLFKPVKLIQDICGETVYNQGLHQNWLYEKLNGNLKAVARSESQLVTKHVVQGKCILFETYLNTHPDANELFRPLMGAYQKSKLNKEAYIKDLFKYASPIIIGTVDTDVFEVALKAVINNMELAGFETCDYVTDAEAIFRSLNMKAAVGALYKGKKRDYFQDYTEEDRDQIVMQSCKRLYEGKLGIWNGSLKAELRPIEKTVENKTRSFTAAPIDTLLAGKVCVDDFNNQFYSLHFKCPWSVGMTKFYRGWDTLLNKLPDNWVYCDADGSQFDSSLSPYLINAVLRLRLHFMEPFDLGEQMLSNLYTEIIYTPILTPDGTIVKKFKGNNSGQPSTVVDNTLMVVLAMTYSLEKLGYRSSNHVDICQYFVNGDDLLLAVNPDYEHVLDNLQELFLQLGLKYTFKNRSRNKEDLWFMSHRGLNKNGIFIPKLEEERIVSILEWSRATQPEHRLEAICAAMIESWGYDWLTKEIRKFYSWVLEQAPYNEIAKEGKAPYISEMALRQLYTSEEVTEAEIHEFLAKFEELEYEEDEDFRVYHQGDNIIDAGSNPNKPKDKTKDEGGSSLLATSQQGGSGNEDKALAPRTQDKDIDAGTSGTYSVPKLKAINNKMRVPKIKNKNSMNLEFLLNYLPEQGDITNTRATQSQYENWYEGVKQDYNISDNEMEVVLSGLMVWCLENGTSPNLNGMWTMMDGEEQREFPIKPLIDHAKPTFRQIMHHFSDVAVAYIEMRNSKKPYMPGYGLKRNLRDRNLACYAFDFYEMTSRSPDKAREAHLQMKAAALKNTRTKLFGLDGSVGTNEEDTERHTVTDVNRNLHSLLGMQGM